MPQKHCSVGVTFGNLTPHSSPGNSQCTGILQALKVLQLRKQPTNSPLSFVPLGSLRTSWSTVHFARSSSRNTPGNTVFETQHDRRCIWQATSWPESNASRPRSPFSYPGLPASLRCLLKWTFIKLVCLPLSLPRGLLRPAETSSDFPKGDRSSALLHTLKQIKN